jgi:uncharacterized protein YecT (DUF1311 family)
MRSMFCGLSLLALAIGGNAYAYDIGVPCDVSSIAKVACADAEVGRVFVRVNAAYRAMQTATDDAGRLRLQAANEAWARETDAKCGQNAGKACVIDALSIRSKQLGLAPLQPPGARATEVRPVDGAPSFNCGTAKSASARLICSDPELSKIDGILGGGFKLVLGNKADDTARKAAIAEQVAWIKDRNEKCGLGPEKLNTPTAQLTPSKTCVLESMKARTVLLMEQAPEDPESITLKRLQANSAGSAASNAAKYKICADTATACIQGCNDDASCETSCNATFAACKKDLPESARTTTQPVPSQVDEFNKWTEKFEVNCFDIANGGRVVVYNDLYRTPIWGRKLMSGQVNLGKGADFESLSDQAKLVRFAADLYRKSAEHCRKEAALGKGEFTANFAVIVHSPPPPFGNSWAEDIWWSLDGVNISVLQPNISRFAKDIAGQIRVFDRARQEEIRRQQEFALEQQRVAQIVQTNFDSFTSSTGLQQWVGRSKITANPFAYKGQIVAMQMWFIKATAENEAIFANYCGLACDPLFVRKVDVSTLQPGEAVVIAVRVVGMRKPTFGEGSIPDLELVGIRRCSEQRSGCNDFGKFDRDGDLIR